jgi:hypothetical protein
MKISLIKQGEIKLQDIVRNLLVLFYNLCKLKGCHKSFNSWFPDKPQEIMLIGSRAQFVLVTY